MKTILALVDFSDVSVNALSFAAELAKRAAARLILINILQKDGVEEDAKNMLQSVEANLKRSFDSGLNCESTLIRGNLITGLKKITAIHHPDLIVMGTRGASGLKKLLIGSNTVKVIAKINVPVLVIPEEARFENFIHNGKNRIVLATDLDLLKNDNSVDVLKEIALLIIQPKVRVLSVRPKNTMLPDVKRLERDFLLSLFSPEIETERVTVFSKNVMGGINFYLGKNADTGLIAMIANNSGALIQKHYTREMASHTNFPLLVLHDNEI
jgi:nucleotide-binding universal stress UspA family protein